MLLTQADFDATKVKISKLNRRAAKKGWNGLVGITGEKVTITETGPSGLPVTLEMIECTITGNPPKYEGWTFLARIEWTEAGPVVFNAPGIDNVDRDSLRDGACDHCKINRYRKNVFLVRNDDGTQLQVGSTCLKDFLGWDINPSWVSEQSATDLIVNVGGAPDYSVETILAAAWACIQEFGYHRSGEPNSTKYAVATVLDPRTKDDREFASKIRPHVDQAYSMAKMVREFILSDEFSGDSDYVWNLKNVAKSEFVTFRFFGYLVSAPQAWAKAQERTLIRQRERGDILNEWNGKPGDKLELTVTLTNIRFVESMYGTSSLYTFKDSDNRIYTWFSSRVVFVESQDLNRTFKLRGTVKRHTEYRGTKQTQLTRCKEL